jgi:predicted ATPase/class 3 adenylate cyclase
VDSTPTRRIGRQNGRVSTSILPTGTVTFVFTDIEGSTALLDRLGEGYGEVLFTHHRLLREVWVAHGGVEVSTEGDAFFVAFASASAAVAACGDAQAVLATHVWPHGEPLRVRMGVHTGEPRVTDGDYWGPDVHYAARIASAARGGQVLVSAATAAIVAPGSRGSVGAAAGAAGAGAGGTELTTLGLHRVKDFPEPLELFAVGSGPQPAPKTLNPLRSNLPSAVTELVGRQLEVDELCTLLTASERLVTLTGAGGTGKTCLALAVADRLVDELGDGAFLVDLSELSGAEEVAVAVAGVVGGGADALDRAVGDREMLLVLDNFEHVLDAAPVVRELIRGTANLRVLVTSQAPLRVSGEHVYALEPLGVPAGDRLEDLESAPAARLLIVRARLASRGFALDDSNAAAVAELVRELDGSPLAIELAGARLALLGPAELLQRLRRSPDALGKGGRDLPERQRGLRAAMSWSYELLAPESQQLFRRLGHFQGEASLERIEELCGDGDLDVLEALAGLVDLSLVRRTRDGRFELPSALRSFARELLVQSGERDALNQHHLELLIEEYRHRWVEEPISAWTLADEAMRGEVADIAACLDWAADRDHAQFATLIAFTHGTLSKWITKDRWRDLAAQTVSEELLTGPALTFLRLYARRVTGGDPLDICAAIDGDALWARALLGVWVSGAINNGLTSTDPRWPDVERIVAQLATSPEAGLRDLARDLQPYLLYARERWEEAGDEFEALVARGGTTWTAIAAIAFVGDCHLLAGRPLQAFEACLSAAERTSILGYRGDMSIQVEGCAASLAALERHREAVEMFGAADMVDRRERDTQQEMPFEKALAALRAAALGALSTDADAAYARGHGLRIDEVVPRLREIAGSLKGAADQSMA